MTELDLQGLKSVVEKAVDTAPWRYEQYHRVWNRDSDPVCKPYGKTFGQQDAYGEFIATFDPIMLARLLSEVESRDAEIARLSAAVSRLEGERDEAVKLADYWKDWGHKRAADHDKAAWDNVPAYLRAGEAEARALAAEAEVGRLTTECAAAWSTLGKIGSIVSLAAKTVPEPGFTPLMDVRALASAGCQRARSALSHLGNGGEKSE